MEDKKGEKSIAQRTNSLIKAFYQWSLSLLQKPLQKLDCIMCGQHKLPVTHHSEGNYSENNKQCVECHACDMEKTRNSLVPYESKSVAVHDSLSNPKTKIHSRKVFPKVKTTKAQEKRAKFISQSNLNAKRPCYEIKSTKIKKSTNNIIVTSSSVSSKKSSPI